MKLYFLPIAMQDKKFGLSHISGMRNTSTEKDTQRTQQLQRYALQLHA